MREAFTGIGGGGPTQSEPERFFRAWRSGELTLGEYQAMTAHWVAENARVYQPRYLPLLPESLQAYVNARLANRRERDGVMAHQVGAWLQAVNEALYQNHGDASLLRWCQGVLREHGATALVAKLETQLDILSRGLRIPPEFGPAVRCQRLDSDAKRRMSA